MKKFLIIIAVILSLVPCANAVGVNSVNYDQKTVAAMVSAYGAEAATEMYYSEQVRAILDRYSAAEVAAAGIFASKYLDRKALTNLGIWTSADENYYYRRIYGLVSVKIMPKIWTVAQMMLHSPQNALYWGSYIFKVCQEVETLCMQFESIVTNSSLSFRDLVFLQIAPQFLPLFNLANAGAIDWKKFFDDLSTIPDNFTKETIEGDIDKLYNMGVALATAGAENAQDMFLNESTFNAALMGNLPAILDMVENSYEIFTAIDQDMQGTMMAMIGGPEAVASLFNIDEYNMTSWMTDYLRETMGQYYTQRWYIYRQDSGSELQCDYNPPDDSNSVIYGNEWYRISTTDPNFYPNPSQTNAIKANSERYAGWSQAIVNQLNQSQNEYTYSISYNRKFYVLSRGGSQYAKAFAYAIRVTRSWDWTEEAYEEVFDSYSMDKNAFLAMLQAKLSELNDNEEGYTYVIGSDEKNYYSATDEAKLKGTESVIISVTCHDNAELMSGSTSYKCRECGSTLSSHTKNCSMKTSVSESAVETSDIDALISEYQADITSIQMEINSLELENQELVKQIALATTEEAIVLRQQYNDNKNAIDRLKAELENKKKDLSDAQNARAEALEGEEVPTDDYYRIPAIMADCKTAFGLAWNNDGHWQGYTYIRNATCEGINGTITFKASLSIARKPKKFLGILIHRAIVKIDWKLVADYSDTQVIDILELDSDRSDSENAAFVNDRVSEIALEYPNCTITTEYVKSEGMEDDESRDKYHLLWSSDRLEIARQIETRLAHIYADLVSLEKMMHYKLSIIDYLRGYAPYVNDMQGKKLTILEEAYRRWINNAKECARQ